jgi:hypothetical protein
MVRIMLNSRYPLLFARIARRCRVGILTLLAVGMILMAAHTDIARAAEPGGPAAGLVLADLNTQTGPPVTIAETQTASCAAQTSCHHGQPLFSAVPDTEAVLVHGNFRRLIPGQIHATGHRVGLDLPPPIA